MKNSYLTISNHRLPDSDEQEFRASLSLNDVVNSRYVLCDRLLMLYKPRGADLGGIQAQQGGLRDHILQQLEAELQDFVRKEIAYKFSQLRNDTGVTS